MYLYNLVINFFLVKKNLKAAAVGEEDKWQKGREDFDQHALLHHQAVLHYILPPLSLHLLLIIIILLLLFLILLLLLLFKEVWKASRPSLLSCKDL